MPGWEGLLSDAEINDVADRVRRFDPTLTWEDDPQDSGDPRDAIPPQSVFDQASTDLGRQKYKELGCPACHGKEGLGDGSSAKDLRDTWNQPAVPRNLTQPWTFRGGASPQALYARLAFGIGGTPMPGYLEVASPNELAAVVAYINSLAHPAPGDPNAPAELLEKQSNRLRRGEYLVQTGNCAWCHSSVDAVGSPVTALQLAGGRRIDAGPHGIFFASNLTPDPETGIGHWSENEIAVAIRSGHTRDRRLNFWAMPWMLSGALTQDDAVAIGAYLKTVPPVRNLVPPAIHFGVIETVVRKLAAGWPVMTPERLELGLGNYGHAESSASSWADRIAWLQVVLVIFGGLLAFSVPGADNLIGVTLAVGMVSAVLLALAAMLSRYPELNVVPAEAVVQAFASAVPTAEPDKATPRQKILWEQGRYLYRGSGCVLCHAPNGSGNVKLNAATFGTVWSSNLTTLDDVSFLRGLRSGITRRGRPMVPALTLWTAHSHFTEEDRQALLTFVRSLPKVTQQPPSPAAAGVTDCSALTIWTGSTSNRSGCN